MTNFNRMPKKSKKPPLIVIFGRTNVGKSTLFNCLSEKKHALTSDIPGTTRDANICEMEWRGHKLGLVDTGGIIDLDYLLEKKLQTDDIEAKVQKQARDYLKSADLILFLVDSIAGITPQDKQLAILIKKILPPKVKILLVANKADSPRLKKDTAELYQLSLGEPFPISAVTGSGTGDLLDLIIKTLKLRKKTAKPEKKIEEPQEKTINVCIIGQPNAGKSSLLNAIMGEERVIVSSTPHTTREPQDTDLIYKDKTIKIVDTAGMSREGQKSGRHDRAEIRTSNDLIKSGISKSLGALNRATIALLVLDINKTITHQDQNIMEEAVSRKKSLIIVANKWDQVPEKDTKKYTEYIYDNFPYARWAKIQFVSALTGEKVKKIMDLVLEVSEQRKKEISGSTLNTFMMQMVKRHRPSKGKGVRHPRIHKFLQVRSDPPRFEISIGSKEDLHDSYVRFIENRLREKFGFLSTPISIRVTKGKRVHGSHGQV